MRLRRARGAIGITAVVLALVACGSFGEASDAPSSPTETEDGGEGGGGSIPDAKVEEASKLDAPGGACPPTAFFCEGFEGNLSEWSGVTAETAIAFKSGKGNVLTVSVPPGNTDATIERAIAGAPGAVKLSFALNVDRVGYVSETGSSNFSVAVITDASGTNPYVALYLARGGTGTLSAQVTGFASGVTVATGYKQLPYGEWHRIDLLVMRGASGKFGWALDGAIAEEKSLDTPTTAGMKVILGVNRPNATTPAITLAVDDVVVSPP